MNQKVNDLRQLPYRGAIVYGPIQSRRIGWSLGVNLCPAVAKVCSFDCIYCQFPRASGDWRYESGKLLRVPELLNALEEKIYERVQAKVYFDSITVSGNGDPSVHPDLLSVAYFLRDLIKRTRLRVALSILTNAVPYEQPDFIEALSVFERKMIKLDAGTEEVLRKINRPRADVCLERLADAVAQLDGVILQTMVVTGVLDNRGSILSRRYSQLVERTGATEVQLYTIDKRPAYDGVLPVSEQELNTIADELKQAVRTAAVTVYYQDSPSGFPDKIPPRAD